MLKIYKYLFILIVLVFFACQTKASAASLSLLPNNSTVSVGNTFSIKVFVDTENRYINTTESVIEFPTDLLEVVSISKTPSIFSMWVEEPRINNNIISFNGGIPTPGYKGQNGQILTILFKAKEKGIASIFFKDGSVRENDGLGTDVLTSKNKSNIEILGLKEVEIPRGENEVISVHKNPIITSSTHINQEMWYSNNTATFNWIVSSDVSHIESSFNKIPNSVPSIVYDKKVIEKTINNINDGTSYFHLGYIYEDGTSTVSHYKINIDTVVPELFTPTVRVNNLENIINLNAKDITSGIDHYEILIDSRETIKVSKNELIHNEYILPIMSEGNHNLTITAYDKAGNKKEVDLVVYSKNSVPKIYLSSEEITRGESVSIYGTTDYPQTKVSVSLERRGDEIAKYYQTTGEDGSFSITTDKIKTSGYITVTAQTEFSDTFKSQFSQKVYLKVNQVKAVKITLSILYPVICLILIIGLFALLLLLIYLGWHKYFGLKRKIEYESKRTIKEINKEMEYLKEELDNQLITLEKTKIDRNLNKKEEEIFAKIQKNINKISDFIDKKLGKFK